VREPTATGPAALVLALAAILLVGAAAYAIFTGPAAVPLSGGTLSAPNEGGQPIIITVKAGDNAGAIGDRLEAANVIDNAASFQRLAKISAAEKGLAAGDYEFLPGTSVLDALTRIRRGLTAVRLVTVPEGLRLEEVAAVLEKQGVVKADDFLRAVAGFAGGPGIEPELLQSRPSGASLEGYLYPATYSFAHNATANDVVAQMVKALSERFNAQLRAEAKARGLTVQDVLTLASIIEREAVHASDKPIMASVYLNRLKQKMPLQADPTLVFICGDFNLKRIMDAHKENTSPYNTYKYKGLPPGPIRIPDIKTIDAVLNYEKTKYIYFCASSTKLGYHAFAETYREQINNAKQYQKYLNENNIR